MEFKSLIIVIVGFQNFVCYLAWAVDLGVDEGRSLYIGSFCIAMTSLSRYLEEAAFNISISSSVFIFLLLFSRCIMDIVSFIVFISCPLLSTCSENMQKANCTNFIALLLQTSIIQAPVITNCQLASIL